MHGPHSQTLPSVTHLQRAAFGANSRKSFRQKYQFNTIRELPFSWKFPYPNWRGKKTTGQTAIYANPCVPPINAHQSAPALLSRARISSKRCSTLLSDMGISVIPDVIVSVFGKPLIIYGIQRSLLNIFAVSVRCFILALLHVFWLFFFFFLKWILVCFP